MHARGISVQKGKLGSRAIIGVPWSLETDPGWYPGLLASWSLFAVGRSEVSCIREEERWEVPPRRKRPLPSCELTPQELGEGLLARLKCPRSGWREQFTQEVRRYKSGPMDSQA